MLYTLVYVSSTNEDVFKESDIEQILEKSRQNNPPMDITGMLLYRQGMFVQVLEGPRDNVKRLTAKISLDDRHRNFKVVGEHYVEQRSFDAWSMKYSSIAGLDMEWANDLLKLATMDEDFVPFIQEISQKVAS